MTSFPTARDPRHSIELSGVAELSGAVGVRPSAVAGQGVSSRDWGSAGRETSASDGRPSHPLDASLASSRPASTAAAASRAVPFVACGASPSSPPVAAQASPDTSLEACGCSPLRAITRDRASMEEALSRLGPECDYRPARLAARLGVSSRHLQRVFARRLGVTPREWLSRQRMQRARSMLLTASSVKEVALGIGMRQLPQFSRDFKAHFGCCPSSLLPGARALRSGDSPAASEPTLGTPSA